MLQTVLNVIHKNKFLVVGVLLSFVFAAIGMATTVHPAAADACDKVNIIYCGLDGSSAAGYINSFQAFYDNGSNNGYNDLKAVFRWAGATNASVAGMNTTNTKVGTLYRNGDIKVDDVVVGHDAWVAARFGAGQAGFTQITDNAWARKTTTSLENDTYKVIVHYGADGNADFAVMVICGNAVKFTPVPQPKPKLSCDQLTAAPVGDNRQYRLTARATASNTTIDRYVFSIDNSDSQVVRTADSSASITQTFNDFDVSHQVRVTVYSADFTDGVTSADCTVSIHTSNRPSLSCVNLEALDTSTPLTKSFVATASASNAKITNYTFTYTGGDGTTKTEVVTSSATSVTQPYTFAQADTTYTVRVAVNGTTTNGQSVTAATCTVNVTTPKPNECKPGVPVGDKRCNECKPGVPMGSEDCNPKQLVNTGPGSLAGLAGVSGVAGVLGRYFYLRRKLGV